MARSFAQAQDETRVARAVRTRWPTASEEATAAISATAAATRNNEQKIRRHDVNEGVGFGFVIIELLVRYSPPRRVFLFGLRIDDGNDASKPKRIVVSTFYRKFNLLTKRDSPMATVTCYLIERAVSSTTLAKARRCRLYLRLRRFAIIASIAELAPGIFRRSRSTLKKGTREFSDYLFF